MVHRIDPERRQWNEPSSESLANDLRLTIRALARDSLKLGSLRRGTTEYAQQKKLVTALWDRIEPAIAQLRVEAARESGQAVRDSLHSRLCHIEREASADPGHLAKPWVHWKLAIDRVLDWLASR